MAYTKLNHSKVRKLASRQVLRPADLRRRLGVSRQMMYYILRKGGAKYARKLATILRCRQEDLVIIDGK